MNVSSAIPCLAFSLGRAFVMISRRTPRASRCFASVIAGVSFLVVFASSSLGGFTALDQFGAGPSQGVAWADYDRDGDLDLAVSDIFYPIRIYENQGGGDFTESTQFGSGLGCAVWGDYDNDGYPDLAASRFNRGTLLYHNEGNGSFTEVDTFAVSLTTLSLAWADYDNDGDLDLALGNSGPNTLVRNEGDGSFTELDRFWTGASWSMAWADYDNDGDPDLAVANDNYQSSKLFRNEGGGNFTELDRFGTGNSRGLAWGDYDRDGDLDLAVTNYGEENRLYRNEGGDSFTELARFGPGVGYGLAWGDYDNDGDLDLAVSTRSGPGKVYVNYGTDFLPPGIIPLNGDDFSYGLAFGDCDGDGDLDVAMANDGQNKLHQNTENDSDYIKIRLEGLGPPGYSNRDGIGAKVAIFDAGTANLRGYLEISAGSGYCSMDSPEAEFGAIHRDSFDIRVEWPASGVVCVVPNVVPPAVLKIREDCTVTGLYERTTDFPGESNCVKLFQNSPNPFHHSTTISYSLPQASYVTLTIYDITGRLVETVVNETQQTGIHQVRWDRKSNPSGVYFYRLRAGEFEETRKMVVVE